MEGVRARAGDRVDHSARGAAELRGVGVGEDLELEHRLHPEEHAAGRARRLVVDVVDVGAVEQEVVLLGARAVDRDLGRAAPDDVVAGGEGGVDAGLEERELLKRAAVEGELADLLLADQPAHRARGQVDLGGVGLHDQFLRALADLEPHTHDRVLADGEANPAASHALESRQREVDLVLAGGEERHGVAPRRIRGSLVDGAGGDAAHGDLHRGQDGAGVVGHRAADGGAHVLGGGGRGPHGEAGQDGQRRQEMKGPPLSRAHRDLLRHGQLSAAVSYFESSTGRRRKSWLPGRFPRGA